MWFIKLKSSMKSVWELASRMDQLRKWRALERVTDLRLLLLHDAAISRRAVADDVWRREGPR